MKDLRQNSILRIISENEIETQAQLMEALSAIGVKSTQATLSRDIKDMRLVKELSSSGRYRYALASKTDGRDYDTRLQKIFRECVTSYATAGNLIVLKTLPGLAQAACAALDAMEIPHLLGTIGGDDTAFLAMKDSASAEKFRSAIEYMLIR